MRVAKARSYAYDAAGNMTNDSINVLTYDGENRVVTSTQSGATYTYSYDGNGLRVEKTPPAGSAAVYIFSGSKVVAEYAAGAAAGSPSTEYIYSGAYSGAQLVTTISGSTTTYQHADPLSARVSTDVNGNPVRTFGHYPFGEVWYETGTASKWKFTSYERDSESGNDYAIARIFANRQGRFLSPDPLLGSLSNPQSLNRYAYADIDGSPVSCYDSTVVTADPIDGNSGGGGGGTPDRLLLMLDDGSGGGSEFVKMKVLGKCIQDLFGVTLQQFNESSPGHNGSFSGWGPDTLSNGGNNAKISVTNDIQTYSGEGLKALRDSRGNPPLPQGTTALAGLTLWDQPYVNYTANNLSQLNQPASMAAETQVHELGNSLHYITGAVFNPATVPGSDKDTGQALENCVRKRGGFSKP